MTHTAESVAKLYAGGESLSDPQIAALQKSNPDAWMVAIDPSYRQRFLPTDKLALTVAKTVVHAMRPLQERIKAQDERIKALEARDSEQRESIKYLEARVRELQLSPTAGPLPGLAELTELMKAPVVGKRGPDGTVTALRVLPPKPPAPPTPEEKLADLEQQVKALSDRPGITYKGVWKADEHYPAGSFVTHSGSCWHAEIASKGVRPGDANNMWKLAVKGTR